MLEVQHDSKVEYPDSLSIERLAPYRSVEIGGILARQWFKRSQSSGRFELRRWPICPSRISITLEPAFHAPLTLGLGFITLDPSYSTSQYDDSVLLILVGGKKENT
jgi:hypothetical protein